MTVSQYQQIFDIQKRNYDDVDRLAHSICIAFKLPQAKVNDMVPAKFLKYCNRLEAQLNVRPYRLYRKRFIIDAKLITLGQFIECQEWLKKGIEAQLHMVGASILTKRGQHEKDAKRVEKMNIRTVLPYVAVFVTSFMALIKQYDWLFKQDTPIDGEEIKQDIHPFISNFGWGFSAKQVADWLRIETNDAMDTNIIEALNTLCLLKSKGQYEEYLRTK